MKRPIVILKLALAASALPASRVHLLDPKLPSACSCRPASAPRSPTHISSPFYRQVRGLALARGLYIPPLCVELGVGVSSSIAFPPGFLTVGPACSPGSRFERKLPGDSPAPEQTSSTQETDLGYRKPRRFRDGFVTSVQPRHLDKCCRYSLSFIMPSAWCPVPSEHGHGKTQWAPIRRHSLRSSR